jgi:hypothetical protein
MGIFDIAVPNNGALSRAEAPRLHPSSTGRARPPGPSPLPAAPLAGDGVLRAEEDRRAHRQHEQKGAEICSQR